MIYAESGAARDAGFTLLELLVALALTATIAAIMAATIAYLRPMQTFHSRLDDRTIASTIAAAIARDLQEATTIPLIDGGGSTSSMLLKGEQRKIVFTAVVPTGFQRQGLREVTYELVKASGKDQLIRTIKLRRFSQNETNVQVDVLFIGAAELRLRYLLQNAQGVQEWRDEFSEINVLPKAVSISFALQPGPQKATERIVVLREGA